MSIDSKRKHLLCKIPFGTTFIRKTKLATRYSKSSHMGDKATNFIREICTNSEKALFIDSSEKDIGIDAHLDILFENGEPTGAFALIQSKGGLSRITKSIR